MKVLVVDDEIGLRLPVVLNLRQWGYTVLEANDGQEAWDLLQQDAEISLIVSDWQMPVMNGIELCQAVRVTDLGRYIYFILLTANSDYDQLLQGLGAGADEFLAKPFKPQELRLRLRAGERVVQLERHLADQNQRLVEAQARLTMDLQSAAKIQRGLLPNPAVQSFRGIEFNVLYIPCEFVAGDTLNVLQLDEQHIGFYAMDAAGHGVPAALLSVVIHKLLSPESLAATEHSLLKEQTALPPFYRITPPKEVVSKLNELSQNETDAMQYFTMVYGVLNVQTGALSLCLAGHPPPAVIRNGGHVEFIGNSGFPVGMLPNLEYDEITTTMNSDDRLMLYSDGIIECTNQESIAFGMENVRAAVSECHSLSFEERLPCVYQKIRAWRGTETFDDDISVLAIRRL